MKASHFPMQLIKVVVKEGTILDDNIIQAAAYSNEVIKTSAEMKTLKKEFQMIIKLST